MRALIITVAGMATRFSESVGFECLKTLYYEGDASESILYRLVNNCENGYDAFIIVGGYRYEELVEKTTTYLNKFIDRIHFVNNEKYKEYGSGYSLYLGLEKAFELGANEIVFAEGDLFVDKDTFAKITYASKSIISTTYEPIKASKSVVLYYDLEKKMHYIFDTAHGQLVINEPFTEIYNSGQVWKFKNVPLLQKVCDNMSEQEKSGTNLVIVQKYFDGLNSDEYETEMFSEWMNCNTVEDYRSIKETESNK